MSIEFNLMEWKELRTYILYIICGLFGGLAQVVALRQVKFSQALRAIITGAFTALVIGLLASVTDWPIELIYALCLIGGFGGTLTVCFIFTQIVRRAGGDIGQLARDHKTFYDALSEAGTQELSGKQVLFKVFTENRISKEQYAQIIVNDKSCLISLLEEKKITAAEFELINSTIF